MAWRVEFTPKAKKDLAKLDASNAGRITRFLRERLEVRDDPPSLGQALTGATLAGLWKYRVGDYRIIVSIEDDTVRVLMVEIGHRREIYRG